MEKRESTQNNEIHVSESENHEELCCPGISADGANLIANVESEKDRPWWNLGRVSLAPISSSFLPPSSSSIEGLSGLGGFLQSLSQHQRAQALESEVVNLKKTYLEALDAKQKVEAQVADLQIKGEKYEGAITEARKQKEIAEKTRQELERKERLNHITAKIESAARDLLLTDERLVKLFNSEKTCQAFVISIDVRKSTTLMLKARDPQKFAMFIKQLCNRLYHVILNNHGVFDKFTGDGVLAFFPNFYSGEDAGLFAIKAASECHKVFNEEYEKHRSCFSSVLTGVGLGIGIDYGLVHLVSLWGGLTVVGSPVVYACRMSGSPAGSTLLNQPAYEIILDKYSACLKFDETELDIKDEGKTLAYSVVFNGKSIEGKTPDWPMLIEKFSKEELFDGGQP